MIFSSFFTPKWKSNKAEQRLIAVSQLDKKNTKHKAILMHLADSDSDVKVKIAALKRINEIATWWQAYQHETHSVLAKTAENELLKENNIEQLSHTQVSYLAKHLDKTVHLKTILPFIDKFEDKLAVLKRIGQKKPVIDVFISVDDAQQLEMFSLMAHMGLQSAFKQHGKTGVQEKLAQQAIENELQKTKPKEVAQQVKVVLAKLNALRDKFNYLECLAQQQALYTQWHQLDLSWLVEQEQAQEKFETINTKLNKHLEQLAQAHQKEQADARQQEAIHALECELNTALHEMEAALKQILLKPEKTAVDIFNALIEPVNAKITMLSKLRYDVRDYSQKVAKLTQQVTDIEAALDELPAITELISHGVQLPIASDLLTLDDAEHVKQVWYDDITRAIISLPNPLQTVYAEQIDTIISDWKVTHQPFYNQAKKLQQICYKQLKDIKRLLEAGRYNICFGLFKGIQEDYAELPQSYRKRLDNDYDYICKKLNEVNDWQREISLPKRHEIIAQVKEEIEKQPENITARRDWIKLIRKRWNELGYVSTDDEKLLDKTFNEQLEIAFTPVRAFYAEQDAIRNKNVEKRQAIIEAYQRLFDALESTPLRAIEKRITTLKQNWRDAGEVDNKRYKLLASDYKTLESTVYQFINKCYEEHASQKAQLIEQARVISLNDDVIESVEQIKQLQATWKKTGFAGRKQDNALWNEFRALNDLVFAKRDAIRIAKKAEQTEKLNEFSEHFENIMNTIEPKKVLSLQQSIEALEKLENCLNDAALHKTELSHNLKNASSQLKVELDTLQSDRGQIKLIELFQSLDRGEIPESWQQSSTSALSRRQLTVRFEILNDLESPTVDSAQRLTEQVSVLQDKVNGEPLDNHSLLCQWLSHGDVDYESKELLARIKPVFL